ncbi:MAG: preprotein translocase subunit SecG [Planctomycetota bacterium]|jgi:preprotein translocase subunit SecG
MNPFIILTAIFTAVSVAMILMILVQRPQGGGLAGAFGGAGGGGADSVFGGRVGDALTWSTVIAFVVYLLLAVTINLVPITRTVTPAANTQPVLETPSAPAGGAGAATESAPEIPTSAPAPAPAPADASAPAEGGGE